MRFERLLTCVAMLGLFGPMAHSQRREFLRGDEVEQVREAQEVNPRLKLYALFAAARLDAVEKALSKPASDERAETIHDLLYEYQRIIDALDDLAEDNDKKRELLRRGLDPVVRAEPDFLKRLKAIEEKNPSDRDTYSFALKEAIETTESSLEENRKLLAKQPKDKRTEKEIEKEAKQDAKDKEERESKKPKP